jgi:hypothetical protein
MSTEKAVAKALMSELFLLCQPGRGDVFSFIDDHASEIAKAIVAALPAALPAERPSDAEGEKLAPGELATELRHEAARQERSHFEPTPAQVGRAIQKLTAAADAIASLTAQLREAERERDEARARMKNTAWAAEAAEAEVARLRSIAERVEAMLTERGNITLGLHNEFRASLQPSPTKTGLGS